MIFFFFLNILPLHTNSKLNFTAQNSEGDWEFQPTARRYCSGTTRDESYVCLIGACSGREEIMPAVNVLHGDVETARASLFVTLLVITCRTLSLSRTQVIRNRGEIMDFLSLAVVSPVKYPLFYKICCHRLLPQKLYVFCSTFGWPPMHAMHFIWRVQWKYSERILSLCVLCENIWTIKTRRASIDVVSFYWQFE